MTRISIGSLRSALRCYLVVGSINCTTDPLETVRQAIAGGTTMVQLREKGPNALQGEERYEFALRMKQLCQEHHVPFIVNDDVELALAVNADGVHVGQDDEPADAVRSRIGDRILGVSVHTPQEALLAAQQGADYVGLGPVFPTKTKADAKAVQGTLLIERLIKDSYALPIVGIGGITADNAAAVVQAGADGVAVVTAITLADSPLDAARRLAAAVTIGGK